MLDIIIDGQKYEFVNSINLNGVNYIAYSDSKNIFIQSFKFIFNEIVLESIDDNTFNYVKLKMGLQ